MRNINQADIILDLCRNVNIVVNKSSILAFTITIIDASLYCEE